MKCSSFHLRLLQIACIVHSSTNLLFKTAWLFSKILTFSVLLSLSRSHFFQIIPPLYHPLSQNHSSSVSFQKKQATHRYQLSTAYQNAETHSQIWGRTQRIPKREKRIIRARELQDFTTNHPQNQLNRIHRGSERLGQK